MIRVLMITLLMGVVCVGLLACSDDDPTEPTVYSITIINNDAVDYEVWIDDNADEDPDTNVYVQEDTVAAQDSLLLANRAVAVFYAFRLILPGQNPNEPDEEFVYEQIITSNGPDIVWEVPPATP